MDVSKCANAHTNHYTDGVRTRNCMEVKRLMLRFFRFLPVVALATAFVLPAQAQEAIDSVCLVSNGKINDGTFNQFTYEGMQRAVDDFGLDSTYIESQAA